jgi:very-short-patch-repair endonuclease
VNRRFGRDVKLVVEIDGSQHSEDYHAQKDKERDKYLSSLGIRVLRFNSREVLKDTDAVIEAVFRTLDERLDKKSPQPPFMKGG